MKFVGFSAAVVASAFAISAPAQAQSYNAFTGFTGNTDQSANGVNNGNFIYGEVDGSSGAVGSFFGVNSNCAIPGTICLQDNTGPNPASLPGVYKSLSGAFPFSTVNVPGNRLVIHPDDDSDLTFVAFVAPTAGVYRLFATFTVQDDSPSGVTITRVGTTAGGPPITYGATFALNGATPEVNDFQLVNLGTSEAIGYGIGNGGPPAFYSNDSTGVGFQVFAGVPEPTTWAMMIVGFGAVGGAMRRRAADRTKVAFA